MSRRKDKKSYKIAFIILFMLIVLVGLFSIAIMNTNASKEEAKDSISDNTTESILEKATEESVPDEPIQVEQKQVEKEPKVEPYVKAKNGIYNYANYSLAESTASNQKIGFWFGRNKNFARPNGALSEETFKKYNSYYIGPNKKVIYLTFDEGNLNTQASKNLDTLKKHGIKGTFFLTKNFIESNTTMVKRMANEGHVVGNHTSNHIEMATMSTQNPQKFIKELADTEDTYKNITGENMDKVFRFPEGTFSERALDFVNQMGYRSIFWSFAYKDWDPSWNTREEALSWMENYYHPGAIYLIHGANVADANALDEFITFMEGKGYSFDVPTNL